MSRVGGLIVACLLGLGGCSVPSLEELEAERGVRIRVQYTPGFRAGCIVMQTEDAANPANVTEQSFGSERLANASPPLELRVSRQVGWGKQLQVTIRAHEQNCTGQLVDEAVVAVDLSGTGRKSPIPVTLETPDEDGDGYVASTAGGADCDDGDAMRSPSQQEICDDKDNNCRDGVDEGLALVAMFRDADGDGVGGEAIQHCVPAAGVRGYAMVGGDCRDNDAEVAPGKTELCDEKDNNCDGTTDEGHDTKWYLDNDEDGVPQGPAFTSQCTSPGPKYMKYPSGSPFDCDDADARRAPNKPELCDGIDNNCASVGGVAIDETFPTKGSSCAQGCGTIQCAADSNSVSCNAPEPDIYYQDQDRDGDGVATVIPDVNPKIVCQGDAPPVSGYALGQDGDCDDRDSARSSIQAELCDGIDNNCNAGVSDEPASCGGTLKQVASHHLSSANQQWNTVAVHSSGYPVWVAGEDGKLAVRRSASAKFESFSFGDPAAPAPTDGSIAIRPNNCGDVDWRVSWVDSSGRVFLGGASGTLAIHNGSSDACAVGGTGQSSSITGLVGFGTGVPVLYVTDSAGKLFRWILGGAVSELDDNSANFYGLHGLTEEFLLAVGGNTGSGSGQRFRSYAVIPGGAATATAGVHSTNVDGNARAVWMGAANKACAVGDNGAVWRWNGGTPWTRVEPSGGVNTSFSSVVMRYDAQNAQNPLNEHCYMVDSSTSGRLRRLTPTGTWGSGPDLQANARLYDVAIATTGDVWIVGEGGRVFHYPEPWSP